MDLLQTVRKEGSRGGRADFRWSDVQTSSHRENYLGHSVMAPVGRWQKNKDLSWYAKDQSGKELSEIDARKAEIRKIKEAEEDALAKALGFQVLTRMGEQNANLTVLGGEKVVQKLVEESVLDEVKDVEGGKGLGYGGYSNTGRGKENREEIMLGSQDASKRGISESRHLKRSNEETQSRREKVRSARSRGKDRDWHAYRNCEKNPKPRRRSRSTSRSRRKHRSRSPQARRLQDRDRTERLRVEDQKYRSRHYLERMQDYESRTQNEQKYRRQRSRSPAEHTYHSDRRRRKETNNY